VKRYRDGIAPNHPSEPKSSKMTARLVTARFSTQGLSERDRVSVWRESLGRQVMRLELEPQGASPFRANFTAWTLANLGLVSGSISPVRVGRTRALLADGDDSLVLHIPTAPSLASQFGREIAVGRDDAVLLSNAEVGTFTCPAMSKGRALRLSRAGLRPLLRDPDGILVRAIPKDSEALRLLRHQLAFLERAQGRESTELHRLFVTHVYDLIAVALGATRDAAETARDRGLLASRLRTIKDDILANLHRADLTVTAVAARHGISPRHVQRLFDAEGETFSRFLLEQRLLRAHRLLTSPRHVHMQIGAIAFDVGFIDLSHFNHAFRRFFGATPSDIRAAACGENDVQKPKPPP
jgi:AraC-like DNA-binding protein